MKSMAKLIGITALAALMAFSMAACPGAGGGGGGGPEDTSPKVTGVEVSGDGVVVSGETYVFTAEVQGTNLGAGDKGVTWRLSGEQSEDTGITGGSLAVGADESAPSITVIATSSKDPSKSGQKVVKVLGLNEVWTVTFDAKQGKFAGGSSTKKTYVERDGKVARPSPDPERYGYSFGAWLLDGDEWDFDDPVTDDITLEAEWTLIPPTVTRVTIHGGDVVILGGTEEFTAEVEGTYLAAGDHAVKWEIEGAESDDTEIDGGMLTVGADESATSITIKATSVVDGRRFDEKEVRVVDPNDVWTVTFDAKGGKFGDGETSKAISVEKGGKIVLANAPVAERSGYTFKAWVLDGAEWDFDDPVTDHIVLEASWTANNPDPGDEPFKITFSDGKSAIRPTPSGSTGYKTVDGKEVLRVGYVQNSWNNGYIDGWTSTFELPSAMDLDEYTGVEVEVRFSVFDEERCDFRAIKFEQLAVEFLNPTQAYAITVSYYGDLEYGPISSASDLDDPINLSFINPKSEGFNDGGADPGAMKGTTSMRVFIKYISAWLSYSATADTTPGTDSKWEVTAADQQKYGLWEGDAYIYSIRFTKD
jgi:uncharacterized repeat protein (TIGR02543 family)